MSPTNSNQNSSRSIKNQSSLMESPRYVFNNNNKYTSSTTTSSSSTSGFVSGITK